MATDYQPRHRKATPEEILEHFDVGIDQAVQDFQDNFSRRSMYDSIMTLMENLGHVHRQARKMVNP